MYKKISLILVTILLSGCSFSGDEINSNYFITNLTENINIDRIDGIISNNAFPILIVSSDDLLDVEIVLTDENSVETKLEYDIEKIEMEETPEYINLTLGEFDWDQYTKLITEAKNIEDEISISTFYDAGINRVKKNVDLIDSKVYFIIAYLPPIDLAKYTEIAIFDNNTLKLTQAINIESHFYENQNSTISTIISSRIGFEVPPHKQTSFDFNFMVKAEEDATFNSLSLLRESFSISELYVRVRSTNSIHEFTYANDEIESINLEVKSGDIVTFVPTIVKNPIDENPFVYGNQIFILEGDTIANPFIETIDTSIITTYSDPYLYYYVKEKESYNIFSDYFDHLKAVTDTDERSTNLSLEN